MKCVAESSRGYAIEAIHVCACEYAVRFRLQMIQENCGALYTQIYFWLAISIEWNMAKLRFIRRRLYRELWHTHTHRTLTHSLTAHLCRHYDLFPYLVSSTDRAFMEHRTRLMWFFVLQKFRNFIQRNFRVRIAHSRFVFVIYFRLVIIRAINTELECVNNS